MRKVLIAALSLASLGALAGVQPAAAAQKCVQYKCHLVLSNSHHGYHPPVQVCDWLCTQIPAPVSTSYGGPGAPKSLNDLKNVRQK
jgi:hypothetical protein